MSKIIRATALVFLLACSAQAGWVQNDSPAPAPTPAPASATSYVQNEPTAPAGTEEELAASGYIQNGVADALVEAALVVLNSGVLALL
jgi:hypothetical protein